uniref:Uncharacterized protein n=2 Tax=viral metagenome TaxID=1070528 RepID=A0A6M3JJ04_9ZZZZ
MMVLNDEEILKAMQEAHPDGKEFPKWTKLGGRLKREVVAIAKAQHGQDIKDFIEWLVGYLFPKLDGDYWHIGDGIDDCAGNDRGAEEKSRKEIIQSLKQLVKDE